MKLYGNIELISGKIINLVIDEVETLDITDTSTPNKIIVNNNKLYFNDGISGYRLLQFSENEYNSPVITSLGPWFNEDLSFNPTEFNNLDNVSDLTSNDSLFTVIQQLDEAISNVTQSNVSDLNDVMINSVADGDILLSVSNTFVNIPISQAILNFGDVRIYNAQDFEESTTIQHNDILSWNSTSLKFNNKKCFYRYSSSYSQSSYIVTHSLGIQYCMVECINKSSNQKIKSSDYDVVYNNSNYLTITFNTDVIAEIVVFSLD